MEIGSVVVPVVVTVKETGDPDTGVTVMVNTVPAAGNSARSTCAKKASFSIVRLEVGVASTVSTSVVVDLGTLVLLKIPPPDMATVLMVSLRARTSTLILFLGPIVPHVVEEGQGGKTSVRISTCKPPLAGRWLP